MLNFAPRGAFMFLKYFLFYFNCFLRWEMWPMDLLFVLLKVYIKLLIIWAYMGNNMKYFCGNQDLKWIKYKQQAQYASNQH